MKKSRGINELAEQIEPLAQSMATLADEARQVMSQTQQASEAWTGAGQISACSACVGTHACYTMSTHAQKGVLWNTKKAL
ncbi:IncQ-type mobilization protein MobB, partial [Providencia rettgeri]